MAKLTSEQGNRLEDELIAIFQNNPQESYQGALELVKERHPDLAELVVISDINYRVPKLRRAGRLPASQRVGRGGAKSQAAITTTSQHPVARAYQELDDAKRAVEEAQRRYTEAQVNLRVILKESLPQDFLETLVEDMSNE